ncbi:tetratricopeptide repeat protein [Adhaeribacter radiodurans]|uniref:Tetratricopeptide repeat protein n=1 Tax=Adhaeribacter radiodurans TaxID=2745197 RepID=A0A7L7LAT1_9BACT|nr:hypothetical protein [Adhaeribacter radiodurans]QMU29930.1 hypothetical protein HUW48_18705 [Adhaeribacter radiodurans]
MLPQSSSKYQVAFQVFDRLTYAFANNRPKPELEIIARSLNKDKVIALYKPGNQPIIQLDEEAYDLCTKLGKDSLNALAVLLSHELAHHYEKHDWFYTFGIGPNNTKVSKELINRFESEADFYGCFYGELSGYATGRVFPRVLDLLYEHFNLSDRLEGYPTKEARKAVYNKMQKEALQMVAVFKAGLFLYLVQEYGSAATCFDYLVNRFPSREILNNLAAAKLQQALLYFSDSEHSNFVYPVELDPQSRIASPQREFLDENSEKQYLELLSDARKYAEKAKSIDPQYFPSYINLACIYSLQGNQAAAIGIINEINPARLPADAYTIRAIAYYKDNQLNKAEKDFEAAQAKNAYMAKYNLDLYNKLDESLTASLTVWIRDWFKDEEVANNSANFTRNQPEQIDGERAIVALPAQAPQIKISRNPNLTLQWNEHLDHFELAIQSTTRNYLVRFTQDNYFKQTVRKIKRGTPASTVVDKYGEPGYTFPGATGAYWVYPKDKIAFMFDKNSRITNWVIYTRSL